MKNSSKRAEKKSGIALTAYLALAHIETLQAGPCQLPIHFQA